jgi:hypothetical protein
LRGSSENLEGYAKKSRREKRRRKKKAHGAKPKVCQGHALAKHGGADDKI